MNTYYGNKKLSAAGLAASAFTGAAAGIALGAALLCACAAIFVKLGSVPVTAAPYVSAAVGVLGAFCGGYVTVKLCGSRGMLMGAITGALMFAAVLITGVVAGDISSVSAVFLRLALYCVSGSVGGIIRVNRRVRVK